MSAPALALFPLTDAAGVVHLVTDDALVAGHRTGCYLALCGSPVLAASLATPDRGSCLSCHQRRAGQ